MLRQRCQTLLILKGRLSPALQAALRAIHPVADPSDEVLTLTLSPGLLGSVTCGLRRV